jgi:hypothetical protein
MRKTFVGLLAALSVAVPAVAAPNALADDSSSASDEGIAALVVVDAPDSIPTLGRSSWG